MAVKKINTNEQYTLKGALRKNGFCQWRLVTSGVKKSNGEERTFFIEFYIVNPALSTDECIMGFKSRFTKNEAELQYALTGTDFAKNSTVENYVQPSFAMVKAGVYGDDGKQVNAYFPFNSVEVGKTDFVLKAGKDLKTACVLGDGYTQGVVQVTKNALMQKPELLGQSGTIGWNLKFVNNLLFKNLYSNSKNNWNVIGGKTDFTGTIMLDGEEYCVNSDRSFGYYDRKWGKEACSPYFHLNASNLISQISGKSLDNSCFVVEGESNGALNVLALIENERLEFDSAKSKKLNFNYDFTEMPEEEDGIKVHWSVSISDRKRILDIDVYCNTKDMFIRDYESPDGGRKLLKVLGGGTGTGELRLYHKFRKNIELIEHVRVVNAICEYGNFDFPEK